MMTLAFGWLRRWASWFLGAAWLASGCTAVVDLDAPDGGPMADVAIGEPRRLLVLGERSRTLRVGEEALLAFRYEEPDGRPVTGEPVHFALLGAVHDASLDALRRRTDERGEVRVRLHAGSVPATFRVRASAERAAEVFVDVAVSDRGSGAVVVRLRPYEGGRAVRRVVLRLRSADDACPLPWEAVPDREALLGPEGGEQSFEAIAVGVPFAVAAFGVGQQTGSPEPVVLAAACARGQIEREGERLNVRLTLEDLPLRWQDRYAVTLLGDASAALEAMGPVLLQRLQRWEEASGGLAQAFLVEAERWLRERGWDTEAEHVLRLRANGAWVAQLRDAWEGSEHDLGPGWRRFLLGELQDLLSGLRLYGELVRSEPWRWRLQRLGFAAADGAERTVPLASLGGSVEGTVRIAEPASGDVVSATGGAPLGLDPMGQALLQAWAEGEPPWVAIAERMGCGDWLPAELSSEAWAEQWVEACDATCVQQACEAVARRVASEMQASLAVLRRTHPSLRWEGRLALQPSEDAPDRVGWLRGEDLAGGWPAAEGGSSDVSVRWTLMSSEELAPP